MSAVSAPDGGGTRPEGGETRGPRPAPLPGAALASKIFAQLGRHVHLPVPGEVAGWAARGGRSAPPRPPCSGGAGSAQGPQRRLLDGASALARHTSGAILLFPPRKTRSAQRRAHNLTQSGLLTPERAQDAPEAEREQGRGPRRRWAGWGLHLRPGRGCGAGLARREAGAGRRGAAGAGEAGPGGGWGRRGGARPAEGRGRAEGGAGAGGGVGAEAGPGGPADRVQPAA